MKFIQDIRHTCMKRFLFVLVTAAFTFVSISCNAPGPATEQSSAQRANADAIGRAFTNGTSNVQVEGEGMVTRLLADDLSGSRHQRFIVSLASGQTLLVTHNIELAPRINGLNVGDTVRFYGEYVWNEKGGVIHWTHHDPKGQHVTGWVEHNGKRFN